jgi:hypothetical protein
MEWFIIIAFYGHFVSWIWGNARFGVGLFVMPVSELPQAVPTRAEIVLYLISDGNSVTISAILEICDGFLFQAGPGAWN